MISFYEPGERFATMSAGHVAKIWRVNTAGVPVPDHHDRNIPQSDITSIYTRDPYDPDDPEGYRPRSRHVVTTPPIPDVPVAPPTPEGGESDDRT